MRVCKEEWLVGGSAKGGGLVHQGVSGAAWHSRGVLSASRALLLSPACWADLSAAGADYWLLVFAFYYSEPG